MMRCKLLIRWVVIISVLFTYLPVQADTGRVENEKWPNGKVRVSKKYDDLGDLVGVAYYRKDGTLEEFSRYDENGHTIETAYYGENGKLREGADGWAAMLNKYVGGNLVMENYYDSRGKLQERKQYNDLGDLVSKQYIGDKEPLPAEEYDPAPTLAGESMSFYDQYGRGEGTTSVEEAPWPFLWYDD